MQQVNLYQDELKIQKLNYSSSMLIQFIVIFVVVLSVIAGVSYFQLQQHRTTLLEKQQRQKIAFAGLQKIQAELALRKKDGNLVKRISEKTKELANKQKVLTILSRDEFGNTKGFVEYVSGLARQRIEGLWLTKIRIASGGVNIALHGTTTQPALVPQYLQRLSSEKTFSGIEFESLLMARDKKKKSWLNFSLQNKKSSGGAQ